MKYRLYYCILLYVICYNSFSQTNFTDIDISFKAYSSSIINGDTEAYLNLIHPSFFEEDNRIEQSRKHLNTIKRYKEKNSSNCKSDCTSFMSIKNISKMRKIKNKLYCFVDYLWVREIEFKNVPDVRSEDDYKETIENYNKNYRKKSFQSQMVSYDSINKRAIIVSYDRVLMLKDSSNTWKYIPRRREQLIGLWKNYESMLREFLPKRIIKKLNAVQI